MPNLQIMILPLFEAFGILDEVDGSAKQTFHFGPGFCNLEHYLLIWSISHKKGSIGSAQWMISLSRWKFNVGSTAQTAWPQGLDGCSGSFP